MTDGQHHIDPSPRDPNNQLRSRLIVAHPTETDIVVIGNASVNNPVAGSDLNEKGAERDSLSHPDNAPLNPLAVCSQVNGWTRHK